MMTSLFALPHQLGPATVIRIGGLFNAENLAIAAGRIFVTGSKGVYEAIVDDTGPCLSEIPVHVGIPSDDWLRNGIASDGRRLYLACAHVHRSPVPLFRGFFDNPPDIEQTLLGLGKLLATEIFFGADSYVVAADLRHSESGAPLAFTEIIAASRGAFFANGLDVADDGSIYVANEHPGATGGIYRIRPGGSTFDLYHQCFGCSPNGVRVDGTDLYYSGLQTWPYPAAVLRQVDLLASSTPRHVSRLVLTRPGSIFDDFDVLDGEFMVAEFASWRQFPLGVGGLLSLSRSGALRQEVRTPELNRPSSVRVCPGGVRYLEPGDLLITEKTGHQLLAIRR